VGGGCDEQAREAATVGASGVGNGGDHFTKTSRGSDIERDWVEGCLNLLEASLATGTLGARQSETGPRSQFSQRDRADRGFVRERSGDARVVPINDHGRIEQSGRHLQALVDDAVEIILKLLEVDVRTIGRDCQDVTLRYETPTRASNWSELCNGNTVAGNDERLTGHHGIDDVSVIVSQLSLGNGLSHGNTVAICATSCYKQFLFNNSNGKRWSIGSVQHWKSCVRQQGVKLVGKSHLLSFRYRAFSTREAKRG
jgi:hypothetical protein